VDEIAARAASRAVLVDCLIGMISAGVEGMFATAIAGGASAVPSRVRSAFP
jgi:hypothetical protein